MGYYTPTQSIYSKYQLLEMILELEETLAKQKI